MRRRGLGEPAQLDHGADQGVDLDGAADFNVLQHGGFMLAHLLRAGDALRRADRAGRAPALAVTTDREGGRALHGGGVAAGARPGEPGHSGKAGI